MKSFLVFTMKRKSLFLKLLNVIFFQLHENQTWVHDWNSIGVIYFFGTRRVNISLLLVTGSGDLLKWVVILYSFNQENHNPIKSNVTMNLFLYICMYVYSKNCWSLSFQFGGWYQIKSNPLFRPFSQNPSSFFWIKIN